LSDAGNDEAVRRFLRATSKATDWFYDRRHRDAAVAILTRSSKIETGVAQQIYDYYTSSLRPFPRNCALPDAAVQGNIDYLVASDVIKAPAPPVAKYVDRRFLPA
jgi:ABC-type nitrate/sulfonate/bicarbonate transport system substrate-binding protein